MGFERLSKLIELARFQTCWQRVRVWLVALARSKLVKENEPEENP